MSRTRLPVAKKRVPTSFAAPLDLLYKIDEINKADFQTTQSRAIESLLRNGITYYYLRKSKMGE